MDNNSKKKMNTNLTIVGGGITGCALALLAKKKSYNKIKILEITKKLGGVLKDLQFGNEIFYNGCQYLDTGSDWFKSLRNRKLFNRQFKFFNCKYGSLTDFENKEIYSRNYPEPIFEKKFKNISLKNKNLITLQDRLDCYPKSVQSNLKKWVIKFGINTKEISAISAENGLMISRIFLKKHLVELKKYKLKNNLADTLYGIPKTNLKLKSLKVAVPNKGYNNFFEKFKKELISQKIELKFSSSIKPYYDKKNFSIKNFNELIDAEKIIWSTNPTNLIESSKIGNLESKFIFVRMFCLNLNVNLKENFYINVFSHKLNIFRMYCYKLNGKSKITIECFKEQKDLNSIYKKINQIFLKFKINLKLKKNQKFFTVLQKRFFLTSVNDKKTLDDFYIKTIKSNIINGAWEIYHREKKINKINSFL